MTNSADFGRVAEDGNVFVKVGDQEVHVGSWPEGTAAEALDFFTKRYDALALEVQLLEQRVRSGAATPADATRAIAKLLEQVEAPKVVGDLLALRARLEALLPMVGIQKEHQREEKQRRIAESRARKEKIVAAAEKLAAGTDWRNGMNRLRDLVEEWKSLPRLERSADDALWKRFSAARTTYTKARKQAMAEQAKLREEAKVIKVRLIAEAEKLADSTEWGETSTKFRNLMQKWKQAGPAPRADEETLWQAFRAAQDKFFGAREAANAELDKEFAANAEVKQGLLAEAEALLPITDLEAAKRAFRAIGERWDAAGKVPRDQVKTLEGRLRKVEQAIRELENREWKKSDPEKSARADDMITQLQDSITELEAKLAAAEQADDKSAVKRLTSDLEAKRSFLAMAEQAAAEFSG